MCVCVLCVSLMCVCVCVCVCLSQLVYFDSVLILCNELVLQFGETAAKRVHHCC